LSASRPLPQPCSRLCARRGSIRSRLFARISGWSRATRPLSAVPPPIRTWQPLRRRCR
jgi:hypothetical protein